MKLLHVIVDMQFGSCGKGLFAGYLARKVNPDTIITAWAPNAGHTFVDEFGNAMVNIALPNGIVAPSMKRVLFGPGTIVNPQILMSELERYAHLMQNIKFMIHEHAAVVTENHRQIEAGYGFAIGSTMKGCGAALIDKISRDPAHMNIAGHALVGTPLEGFLVSVEEYNEEVDNSEVVIIEGAQGFSLGINNGFYPYTTSRECTVQQLMVDCAIPNKKHHFGVHIHGVCRTYPIRVANRFNKEGEQIGTSGPCYSDQIELNWKEDLGMEPELTTVTRLPRRIFTFSAEQIRQAVRMNGIDNVFINFANYPMLRQEGKTPGGLNGNIQLMINEVERTGATVRWLGYGPSITDIKELQMSEAKPGKGIVNIEAIPALDPLGVMDNVIIERNYQDSKHGPISTHGHTLGEWILIMEAELAEAKEALIKGGEGRNAVRHEILQVVATGFACLEQHGIEP